MLPASARFFLDESGLSAIDCVEALGIALESLVEALVQVREYEYWSGIWDVEALGVPLSELLFDYQGAQLDSDLRTGLLRVFASGREWDTGEEVHEQEFGVSGLPRPCEIAPTLAFLLAAEHRAAAAVTYSKDPARGVWQAADAAGRSGTVRLVSSPSEICDFWRFILAADLCGAEELNDVLAIAFPRVVFSDEFDASMSALEGDRRQNWGRVLKHLAVLSDQASRIFRESPQSHERIAALGSCGIDASPDSPKTHGNHKAMGARVFSFSGRGVVCEWHSKLEPNRNRIHFAVAEDVVYVGRWVAHLPT